VPQLCVNVLEVGSRIKVAYQGCQPNIVG